jgi:hypothetical protein
MRRVALAGAILWLVGLALLVLGLIRQEIDVIAVTEPSHFVDAAIRGTGSLSWGTACVGLGGALLLIAGHHQHGESKQQA